jgi:hypothetical protein
MSDETRFTLPLSMGDVYITDNDINHWQKRYPDVDIAKELTFLIAWLQECPEKKRNLPYILRLIDRWLSRVQRNQQARREGL